MTVFINGQTLQRVPHLQTVAWKLRRIHFSSPSGPWQSDAGPEHGVATPLPYFSEHFKSFIFVNNKYLLTHLFSPDDMRIKQSRPELYLLESLIAPLSSNVNSWAGHQLPVPELTPDSGEHVGVDEDDVIPGEPPLGVHPAIQHPLHFPLCPPLPWDSTGFQPIISNLQFSWRKRIDPYLHFNGCWYL